jgi:hypothetical protein
MMTAVLPERSKRSLRNEAVCMGLVFAVGGLVPSLDSLKCVSSGNFSVLAGLGVG